MIGGRKVRSNKGKKRGSYRTRKTHHAIKIRVNSNGSRRVSSRKVRSNKGKKRTPYGPRTGKTRSGRRFRQSGGYNNIEEATEKEWGERTACNNIPDKSFLKPGIFNLTGSCSGMTCKPNPEEQKIIQAYKSAGCPWDVAGNKVMSDPCAGKTNAADCKSVGADATAMKCECSWKMPENKCVKRASPGQCM